MSRTYQSREELVVSILLYLGERDASSVSLHEMANVLEVSFLDALWGVILLGRAGYVEYQAHSPLEAQLVYNLDEIDVYTVSDDIQELMDSD